MFCFVPSRWLAAALLLVMTTGVMATACSAAEPWLVFPGGDGPGQGKKIVLISGDEEYRSEESLPMLAGILSQRHGFTCTVLFAIDPASGEVAPNVNDNIPGLDALADADLMIIATRWRNLPAAQMEPIAAYLKTGKPVLGLRTATHALKPSDPAWAHYADGYHGPKTEWAGGFGRVVLGEGWVAHHGAHKKESTRGIIAPEADDHPITRGLADGDIWGDTDVYTVRLPLPGDSMPLVLGQVLTGMQPTDPPVQGKKNDPMLPVAWTKSYGIPGGITGKAFTTTMGSATDLATPGTRRLVVNAVYWLVGLSDQIPKAGTDVQLVGAFTPSGYGFNGAQQGKTPEDFAPAAK